MEIKFICDDKIIIDRWGPKPIGDVLPDWFENMPAPKNDKKNKTSARACMPLEDYITSGYVLYNAYQIDVQEKIIDFREQMGITNAKYFHEKDKLSFNSQIKKSLVLHNEEDFPAVIDNKKRRNYFRFATEWIVKTPPGYSCLVMQPYYYFEDRFKIMPAIIDTDQFDSSIPVFGYLDTVKDISIMPGDPLLQIIPFKRDEWKMIIETEKPPNKSKFFLWGAYEKFFHTRKKFS